VPDSELWEFWTPSDANNTSIILHSEWQALLDIYLITDTGDSIYRFDYAAVTRGDRERLRSYLAELASIDPRDFARIEQKAYWINLYNALTVEVVLANYPVKSIRKIDGGLFGTGPWNTQQIEVAGKQLTLNDIEHRILRPIWGDPRIHYAVNCASLGCPNLAAQVYTRENTEELLNAGASAYINHPRGVTVKDNRITASSIYNWYDIDFGASEQGLIQHWLQYAEPALAAQLESFAGKFRYSYDWALNER